MLGRVASASDLGLIVLRGCPVCQVYAMHPHPRVAPSPACLLKASGAHISIQVLPPCGLWHRGHLAGLAVFGHAQKALPVTPAPLSAAASPHFCKQALVSLPGHVNAFGYCCIV